MKNKMQSRHCFQTLFNLNKRELRRINMSKKELIKYRRINPYLLKVIYLGYVQNLKI